MGEPWRDPYLTPGGVLINRWGIEDQDLLEATETAFTDLRLAELAQQPIIGAFDLDHLRAVHRHIFQDVFEWAGEDRTVEIAKAHLFCERAAINAEGSRIFGALRKEKDLVDLPREKFVRRAAHYYDQVNQLHPFREGNGRAQREFFRQLSLEAGWPLRWDRLGIEHGDPGKDILTGACIEAMDGRLDALEAVVDMCADRERFGVPAVGGEEGPRIKHRGVGQIKL
ncbi:hypothetical protein EPN42_11125 [bacterium]|nr:MAG: hypothetical protein EPN42_11125 [bacterium]